ncbi:hypothetical protein [Providencia huaxiensis]|uniref:hypothetical protein n=1 Tax=Providencia huaxiensis TaxID=2027290 RepID=UPI001B37FE16|nr:hypothetical protein [Providencia huaxiensis]MBQ0533472.1 hypothetical protein [Providencia huaxiensis]MBQ0587029.1 hypothetical protein [Providencia huaxiensis]MDI7238289.1 hypothetical protein [Providencia huaxiensis]
MASNTFDFELVADDKVSNEIVNIEAQLSQLSPILKQTREDLKLGGDDSLTGLGNIGDKIRVITDGAKSGAQSIGDMIPPLKNFGAIAGGLMKAGGIGALVSGGYKYGAEAAENGTKTLTSAKNMGMSVEESTRLSGTLVQKGASKDEASGIMESYYEKLSQANKGQDGELLASIKSIGAELVKNKDGSVNITKTLESLEAAIQELPDSRNWELRDKLKLPPELIALLKEGKGKLKERMARSDKIGLTVSGEHAERMDKLNTKIKDLGAEFEGAGNKLEKGIFDFIYNDSMLMKVPDFGDVDKATNRIKEVEERADDTPDNFYHGDKRKDLIARALKDEDYKKSLSFYEKTRLIAHDPTDYQYKNIEERYGKEWERQKQLFEERKNTPKFNIGDKVPDNFFKNSDNAEGSRGFRNKNPGNLTAAPNSSGYDYGNGHRYVQFPTMKDGLAGMSRQLMLDAERGLNTIDKYLYKYAGPEAGNDTEAYIRQVSKMTGYGRYDQLDMHDPDVMAKLMPAMIQVENGKQPFSYDEIMEGIMESIMDDRWKGKRNSDRVMEQRDMIALREEHKRSEQRTQEMPPINAGNQTTQAVDMITSALSEALQQNTKLEITVISGDKKTTQYLTPKSNARITVPMDAP